MNLAEAMKNESKFTRTENGAVALNTTSDARLDLFSTIGSLRNADTVRITTLFEESMKQDPLFTMKILFYARDIREGLGERKTFRTLLRYAANHYPEYVMPNIDLIGVFGRYDDLYSLIGTKVEDEMWKAMGEQFKEDFKNMKDGNAISLLAKWIKTADASSKNTRKLGIMTARKLGIRVSTFKRIVRDMRKYIGVVERLMSTGQWDKIKYSEVPSRAMMIYRNAFLKHDKEGFEKYIDDVSSGKEKINASTLYPYDLVEKYGTSFSRRRSEDSVIEEQWKSLPNYVKEGTNAIIMADTSGSMYGRPMNTAIGLAIYFAERNIGAYHNLFMTFSSNPSIVSLKGNTLLQKILQVAKSEWGSSTNLKAAFDKVLQIAEENDVSPKEMPKAIVVISDMEIDYCGNKDWCFYDKMAHKFKKHGYEIPNIIFWNVESRHDVFHADSTRKGVQLASGQSVTIFKQVLECMECTPVEAMEKVINSERYACITKA